MEEGHIDERNDPITFEPLFKCKEKKVKDKGNNSESIGEESSQSRVREDIEGNKARSRRVRAEISFDGVKRSNTDVSAAELLYAYSLNCKMLYDEERDKRKVTRKCYQLVYVGDIAEINSIKDNEPLIFKDKEDQMVFKISDRKIRISDFRLSTSWAINQVLIRIKRFVCKEDELALKIIMPSYKEVLEEEMIYNTHRMQDHPQRVTIYVLSKKSSLLLDQLHTIQNIQWLSILL
ncbi:hypothetical protein AgCh_012787 [Apium graveolens]